MIKYCNMKYCLRMLAKHVSKARDEFHRLSLVDKLTHILSLFHNRAKEVISKGHIVLKSLVICKHAFYEIHGFSCPHFYNYKQLFENGAKIGFHGNTRNSKLVGNILSTQAILASILKQSAKPMPHAIYLWSKGIDSNIWMLPSNFSKSFIFHEVSAKMALEKL